MSGPPRSSDGSILAVAFRAAPDLLREFGVDPGVVARKAGFDLSLFDDPTAVVPFSVFGRFLAECVDATNCPHFGLLMGAQEGLTALGIVGHLAQQSADVGTALRNVVDYLHHQEVGGVSTLSIEDDVAVVDYMIQQNDVVATDQIADGGIGIAVAVMRSLCGPAWNPIEVMLMRAKPRDLAAYWRVFRAPVRFGAERNALMFHAKWLRHSLPAGDATLRAIVVDRIAELERQRQAEFPALARKSIRASILAGRSTIDDVSSDLGLNRRTLHRRLLPYGLNGKRLVEETRFEIAKQMLQGSEASMVEIALKLNYTNASAFTRAFRQWSGQSPSQWRQGMR